MAAPGAAPVTAGRQAHRDPVAWLIAAAVFAAYTTISVSRAARLDPGTWDLGIYTEYVRQFAELHAPVVPIKGHGFNLLGDHFTPIVALLAPVFRLFPSPLTLLVAQAALTAVSVVPVCRAGRDLLGTGAGRAIGAAYGCSWGLQQMINFAFHELAFAVPLLAFSLSALVRGRPGRALLWALPLVLVKEDQGVTVAGIGVVMLGAAAASRLPWLPAGLPARGRAGARAWAWAGAALACWGLAWSALAVTVIIPHFNPAHHYAYWRDGGVIGAHGFHLSPGAVLAQLGRGAAEKLATTMLLLLPVGFLALLSPLAMIAVPSVALRFLATDSNYWGTSFHYDAPVMPVMFLAAVDALARICAHARRAATAQAGAGPGRARPPLAARLIPRRPAALVRASTAAMLVIAAGLALRFPLSHLWQPWAYRLSPLARAEYAAMARVPAGVTVSAGEPMLAPLAARDDTAWTRNRGIRDPRYIVYDSAPGTAPARVLRAVERADPGAPYRQVFRDRRVYVFRRAGAVGSAGSG